MREQRSDGRIRMNSDNYTWTQKIREKNKMTNRERVSNILHDRKTDRMPAVHFGYWRELLLEWAAEGYISYDLADAWSDGAEADEELNRLLGWDFGWSVTAGAYNGLSPMFERKVLEKLPDGFLRVQNPEGLIERIREGVESIPAEDDYQLKDREAFEKLYLPKMRFSMDRVPQESLKKLADRKDDRPLGLNLGSVLGSVRNMLSVIGMSYMMCDDFELLAEIIDTYAEMQYRCAEETLKSGAQFDYAHYWEDICFKNGPLLSPTIFEELCAKHYKKRNELCRQYGIDIISLDCDGVIEKLLPIWYENGVNTMFPLEIGTWGDQFEPARKKYGKGLLGIGGMDKTALRKDKAAVDAELERLQRLVDLGGFIPCPDHRLMPGTKWELVQYYADKVKELKV